MTNRRNMTRGGHDRWLVSYADLVTLLLALFTTLYAASTVDARKLAPIQSSLREALSTPSGPAVIGGGAPPVVAVVPEQTRRDELRVRLTRELADALAAQQVEVTEDARGLVVTLPDEATFPVGSTTVAPEARGLILRIARAVEPTPNAIRIEGHSDDVPIGTARYASNWELSSARASAVVAFLSGETTFDPARLSAAGYGEFHPRVPNDSAANRKRNRRTEIVILGAPASGATR